MTENTPIWRTVEDVFTVGLNRAVTVIAEKLAKGGSGRATPAALKDLGEHPDLGGVITVRDGRYGAYVNHAKINATLPKDTDPLTVTMEQAVLWIAEKAAKSGKKPAAAKKPKATKAAKKPAKAATKAKPKAAKKTAAKSAAKPKTTEA